MRKLLTTAIALLVALPIGGSASAAETPHVLVFSGTYGFRHSSITKGNQVLLELAGSTGAFTVEFSENPQDLSAAKLRDVDVLLLNSTTGRVPLTAQQRTELTRFWGCGGGFVGIHAAADANYGWAEYSELVGAQFDSHPHGAGSGQVRLLVENGEHAVNAAYAGKTDWLHQDEYYRWQRDVRGTQDVVPLLAIDEKTVASGIQTGPTPYAARQPVSWVKTFRGEGRVYYNNLGHNEATWDRAEFRQSLVDGIRWTGAVPLRQGCLTGTSPLPSPPLPPVPDPESPIEPCALQAGDIRLTYAGESVTPATPQGPVYFGKTVRRYVLDLSGGTKHTADLGIGLSWELRAEDYDLDITTPWGFGGSDAVQPAAKPYESASLERVPHCTRFLVGVYNHHAATGRGLRLTINVDTPPPPPPGNTTPGTRAATVSPPGATTVGFAVTELVIVEGGSVSMTNADLTSHNIACADPKPGTYFPLCYSEHAEPGQTVETTGVAQLPPGTYPMICELHPQMAATLRVLPGA